MRQSAAEIAALKTIRSGAPVALAGVFRAIERNRSRRGRLAHREAKLLAGQNEIRNRIEELKLSHAGYTKQLGAQHTSNERRERLQNDIRLIMEEIGALEKVAQLYRVEPDQGRIESGARGRLDHLRERMAAEPRLAHLTQDERDSTSGEVRGLLWALGEDAVVRKVREMVAGRERADPMIAARNLPGMLMRTLNNGATADARASAAYEIGKVGIVEAIPRLAAALNDEPIVAELAFNALCSFSREQLEEAGVPAPLMQKISAAQAEADKR